VLLCATDENQGWLAALLTEFGAISGNRSVAEVLAEGPQIGFCAAGSVAVSADRGDWADFARAWRASRLVDVGWGR
jgi:hypothetical protein